MKVRKILSLILALTLALGLFVGCSAGSKADMGSVSTFDSSYNGKDIAPSEPSAAPIAPGTSGDVTYNKAESMAPDAPTLDYGNGVTGSNEAAQTERKLIKNANFVMETLEYDQSVQKILDLVSQSGGYVQNSSVSGSGANGKEQYSSRRADFVLRIPALRLGEFTTALASCGSITNSNEYVDEVTDTYYDVTARLETLELQEDRLLAILEKAVELKDVITLEQALSDVRYQIERYQGQLRRLDDQISMSTVNITLREVYTYTPVVTTPKTLGERLSQSFGRGVDDLVNSFENFLVWLVRNVFNLIIWAVVITVAVLIVRKKLGKIKLRRKASAEKTEKDQAE